MKIALMRNVEGVWHWGNHAGTFDDSAYAALDAVARSHKISLHTPRGGDRLARFALTVGSRNFANSMGFIEPADFDEKYLLSPELAAISYPDQFYLCDEGMAEVFGDNIPDKIYFRLERVEDK